jgi:hypothetical protein
MITQKVPVSIPSPVTERRMGIRCADWDRLKERLSQVSNPIPHLRVAYSVIYGIAATAGLTIIPLTMTEGLSPWVIPLYGCVCFFGVLCGSIFVWLDERIHSIRKTQISDIAKDMEEIERVHIQT